MQEKTVMKDESGAALLIVTILSVLLELLGMSMIFDSMTEFSMSNELENQKKARVNAEAGYSAQKNALRMENLTALLQSTTQVPRYMNYPVPTPGTTADEYFQRNPIAPKEAMNIDCENPPSRMATGYSAQKNALRMTGNGFLTPGEGVSLGDGGDTGPKSVITTMGMVIRPAMSMELFIFVPWESRGLAQGRSPLMGERLKTPWALSRGC